MASLGCGCSQVDASLTALGLNPSARAQDLSLDQWVALCWELHNTVLKVGLFQGGLLWQGACHVPDAGVGPAGVLLPNYKHALHMQELGVEGLAAQDAAAAEAGEGEEEEED